MSWPPCYHFSLSCILNRATTLPGGRGGGGWGGVLGITRIVALPRVTTQQRPAAISDVKIWDIKISLGQGH